jgi:hypothetical protein
VLPNRQRQSLFPFNWIKTPGIVGLDIGQKTGDLETGDLTRHWLTAPSIRVIIRA